MAVIDSQDQSTTWCITVLGSVAADWADYLGGLTIETRKMAEQSTTRLCGPLVDQAALLGVLNNLYNLGFAILSVENQFESYKENNYV